MYFINSEGLAAFTSLGKQSSQVGEEKAEFITRFHWDFLMSV